MLQNVLSACLTVARARPDRVLGVSWPWPARTLTVSRAWPDRVCPLAVCKLCASGVLACAVRAARSPQIQSHLRRQISVLKRNWKWPFRACSRPFSGPFRSGCAAATVLSACGFRADRALAFCSLRSAQTTSFLTFLSQNSDLSFDFWNSKQNVLYLGGLRISNYPNTRTFFFDFLNSNLILLFRLFNVRFNH